MKSGIYLIVNIIDCKFYVGSAFDFSRRFSRHRRLLSANEHPNAYLQNAWNKHGDDAFVFKILEICKKETLLQREQFWLDTGKSYEREIGYNICKVADNRTGVLHSEETKAKMSAARKGMIKSPEWQAKITAAIKGKKRNPEVIKAHSLRMKGRKFSEETKERMRLGQLGRKHSEESKRKRSEKLKGRVIRPKSESISDEW